MATTENYRGRPVLNFQDHETYPTKMGAAKMVAVLSNLPAVLDFLRDTGHGEFAQEFEQRQLQWADNIQGSLNTVGEEG